MTTFLKRVHNVYMVFVCLLMLLVGSVFIYTPGDIIAKDMLGGVGGCVAIVGVIVRRRGMRLKADKLPIEADPVYVRK